MKYERGDVVLVDYPYAEGTGQSKVLPAVVVQSDWLNLRLDSTVIAMTTSRKKVPGLLDTEVEVALSSPTSAGCGLRTDSLVLCRVLISFKQQRVLRQLGRLSDVLMEAVDNGLMLTLHLPR